jgi:hypothetical protein
MDTITNMDELGMGVLELEPIDLEETDEDITGDPNDPIDPVDHDGEDDELTIREEDAGDGRVAVTVIQQLEKGRR